MADPEDAQLSPKTAAPVATDRERGLRREDLGEEWIARFVSQAARLGNYPMLSAAEREASRRSFLDRIGAGEDIWVFAYGSLMWNPAIEIA